MKNVLFGIAGMMMVIGALWMALPTLKGETPEVPEVTVSAQCQGAAGACQQASDCHDDQLRCNGRCSNCPDAGDEDGDGHCDAAKNCDSYSTDCAAAHRTASCHEDGVACAGKNCDDCKEFQDADNDGACDKIGDCGNHAGQGYFLYGKIGHCGRCHAATQQTEFSR